MKLRSMDTAMQSGSLEKAKRCLTNFISNGGLRTKIYQELKN